jgi:hypothetical protein
MRWIFNENQGKLNISACREATNLGVSKDLYDLNLRFWRVVSSFGRFAFTQENLVRTFKAPRGLHISGI